jgi:hypothetical protein
VAWLVYRQPMKPVRAAMIIGHPGHELRVHHWLETARPEVLVLTDGSGRTQHSRLPSTTRILVYGRFTDAEMYQVMLLGRTDVAVKLLEEISAWLIAGKFDLVAGDALEGYNTSHEFCRFLIGAACELVRRQTGRALASYDFLLTGRPDDCPEALRPGAIHLQLDAAAIERKLAAAGSYPELQHEVEMALKQFGKTVFAHEWLRPVANDAGLKLADGKPFYETHGEKQHAAGHYQHVIRAQEHMLPLARAMWHHATR